MATTTGHKIFVGGEWVDAVDGGTMEVLNPATGETIAEVPRVHRRRRRPRGRGREARRCPEWLDTTPGERAEVLLKLADARRGERRGARRRSSRATSASRSRYARDEMPICADNLRFFAGAARILEGRSAGEYMRGYTSMIRREPLGIVGGIAPVELPADDGGLEARARRSRRATSRCSSRRSRRR